MKHWIQFLIHWISNSNVHDDERALWMVYDNSDTEEILIVKSYECEKVLKKYFVRIFY